MHRAKWLLDGVRQGQSLSALLGYRFERGLHEQGLDRYIHRFRTLTSLKENKRFADIHEKLGRAERTAREVAALYAQRDQATGRAADARALRAEREGRAQTYRIELDTIALVAQQAQAADAQVAQAAQALTQQQAAKPQGKVIQPSVRRYAVQLLEERDLDLWSDRADQLMQAQSVGQPPRPPRRIRPSAPKPAPARSRNGPRRSCSMPTTRVRFLRPRPSLPGKKPGRRVGPPGPRQGGRPTRQGRSRSRRRKGGAGGALSQQWREALESLPATNVVDGLALQRRWRASQQRMPPQSPWDATTIPFGNTTLGFPAPGTNDFTALVAQLQTLDNLVDSVGDSVVAESVYQLVQGNPLRSGATLDAIATGEMPPPELDVIRTPRTGIGLTHDSVRFSRDRRHGPRNLADAAAFASRPSRTAAECLGGHHVAQPGAGSLQGRLREPSRWPGLSAIETALTALKLSPLDAVYMAEGSDQAQRAELEQRWMAHLFNTRPASVPPTPPFDCNSVASWAGRMIS